MNRDKWRVQQGVMSGLWWAHDPDGEACRTFFHWRDAIDYADEMSRR